MRFKNFNKIKPIVQNVKTNSVNEGKAPSQADPDNFNDWNPALAHDDVNEAKKGDKTGKGGGKGTPTSSDASAVGAVGALKKYLTAKQKEQKEERIKLRNKEALKELTTKLQNKWTKLNDQHMDHMKDYTTALNKEDEKAIYVAKKALTGLQNQLKNLEKNMKANNIPPPLKGKEAVVIPDDRREAEPIDNDRELAYRDAIRGDLEDAEELERVIAGDIESEKDFIAKDVVTDKIAPEDKYEEVTPPEEIEKSGGEVVDENPGKVKIMDEVIKKAQVAGEFTEEEIEKETPSEERQETALKALRATKAIETVEIGDLHELAKEAGSGQEFMGRTIEVFTGITRCSDSAPFFVPASLKDRGYPQFWKGVDGNCYQNTSVGSEVPAGTKLPAGILFDGEYEGIAYDDCTCT